MILLTWVQYDQYIQQTMQISEMWNHSIDLNLIYFLLTAVQDGTNKINEVLSLFQAWKIEDDNKQKCKKKFMDNRCYNYDINLLCVYLSEKKMINITAIECATLYTINNGLPFVAKDKEMFIQKKS
ncbi:hypothetical protein RFI_36429 [Reticulomyxa filosa]|uniref:Uncharacterized protein n=2 Tax=Reticulomyxa filosa TaxID=46433 RepID=X6LI32_RETFI|nr:hypothetical protein RFI_36429 [Reticulomyxa filosa]|eukprot:ETO01011.1 hypothetical protein RFI_36429 [Reticulomyxa filosa]